MLKFLSKLYVVNAKDWTLSGSMHSLLSQWRKATLLAFKSGENTYCEVGLIIVAKLPSALEWT